MALAPLAVLACVTKGNYDRVVGERDQLRNAKGEVEERVALLEASNESLGAERLQLIDQMEDLRQSRETLGAEVRELERRSKRMSEDLRAREAELASRSSEIDQLRSTYEGLVADLESEVASGQIEIEQLREGLRVNLSQEILFPSGSANVNESGRDVLMRVADHLKGVSHFIEVQGHTDNVPIRATLSSRYPTNWELAGARASQVVRLLADSGVDPNRLVSVSYGEFAPVASNQTPAGRARNRRIEITLQPMPDSEGAATPANASVEP